WKVHFRRRTLAFVERCPRGHPAEVDRHCGRAAFDRTPERAMPSDATEISARGLCNGGEVHRVTLLRGDDLLLAEVGAAVRADAFGAPWLRANPVEGVCPIGHVALVDTIVAFGLPLPANILRDDDVAMRGEEVPGCLIAPLAVRRPNENRRKWP